MDVTVKLFANYRQGRYETSRESLREGSTVGHILDSLKLDLENDPIGILLVNGRHASPEQKLSGGDVVSIFPMLGGG